MTHGLLLFLQHFGYLAIFMVMAIESLGVPSPDEFTLLLAGYLVLQGEMGYVPAVLAAAAGSTTGGSLAFFIGVKGGQPFLHRYGRYISLPSARLAVVDGWFRRHGWQVVFFGRIIPIARLLVSYPAGAFEMKFKPFIIATVAGALAWPLIAVTAGYYLGNKWGPFLKWLQTLGIWAVGLVVVLAVGYYFLHRHGTKKILGE